MFPAPLDNKSSKWVNRMHHYTHRKYDHKSHSFYVWPHVSTDTTSFFLSTNILILTWSHNNNNNTGKKTCVVTTWVAQTRQYLHGNRLLLVEQPTSSLSPTLKRRKSLFSFLEILHDCWPQEACWKRGCLFEQVLVSTTIFLNFVLSISLYFHTNSPATFSVFASFLILSFLTSTPLASPSLPPSFFLYLFLIFPSILLL